MRRIIVSILIFFILITLSSCTQKSNNSSPKPDEAEEIIHKIEDFEKQLISIMEKVDLVPYYEKQIKEKKAKENKEKEKSTDAENKGGEGNSGQNSEAKKKEFKPKPITNQDILLLRLLEEEKSYKSEEQDNKEIPDDIVFIWNEINENINQLHLKWNDLESKLKKGKVSTDTIDSFDKTLNNLTVASNNNKSLETLTNANGLTLFISQFIKDLGDTNLALIYSIKYYTRQIILDVAKQKYNNADKNLDAIKSQEEILSSKVEKENKELVDKLKISLNNLENAISLKDINVIKLKASIIIKNTNTIKEKL